MFLQDIDKKQVTTFQQQNKAALATAFSEKVLNEYRDKLSEEAAGPSGAQGGNNNTHKNNKNIFNCFSIFKRSTIYIS